MKPAQYRAARDALGWTHAKLAQTIGVTERTPYRYANQARLARNAMVRTMATR
jgi:hypothetical protein